MSRPRSNTPEGRLATERWRETMQERYGNVTEKMQEIGSRGGKASNTGGFASKKVSSDGLTGQQRAVKFGAVGGRISRRGKKVVSN